MNALHYLKFFLFHVIGLCAAAALYSGGVTVCATLAGILLFYIVGDLLGGDDLTTPTLQHRALLTGQLWLALPLLLLIVAASVASFSAGRYATMPQLMSGVVLTGLMIGLIGTITAHELIHRTTEPVSLEIGRWLLAFSFDVSFAIEHVYGHHRYVSTSADPATAPRGRNVYWHIVCSTVKGNRSAWRLERKRLERRGQRQFSHHNLLLRGYLMSAALVAAAGWYGGLAAALYFSVCALFGKALLEVVNYMEHYGMVRNPARPVQPHHSWNTNKRLSSWTMFNLTRHSHHHARASVAYHDLQPYPDAPMMISGYLSTLLVALLPPLWHALMTPKVLAWDRDYASEEERQLAAAQPPLPRAAANTSGTA